MSGYAFAVASSIALVAFLVLLLRQRRLREKYAFIWIAVALGVCVLGAFPGLVGTLARLAGVQTSANLLFSASLLVLLFVCIQLSVEVTVLEEETRTLAEEVAILRLDVERALAQSDGPTTAAQQPRSPEPPAPSVPVD